MIFAPLSRSHRTAKANRAAPVVLGSRFAWSAVRCLTAVLLAVGIGGTLLAQPADRSDGEQEPAAAYAKWVEHLGSDQYVRREMASRKLFEAGPNVVPHLESAIGSGDLETTERSLQILQVIAMRQNPSQTPVAWEALQRLTNAGSASAATRAREMLATVSARRVKRAREALGQAGIKVDLNGFLPQANATGMEVAHITDDWNGELSALDWLPWLYGIQFVLLEGASVDQSVLEKVTEMPDLRNVVFSKTEIEPGALNQLSALPRIDTLELRYVPVGDQAAEHLAALPIRQSLRLIGTNISSDGLDGLRQALPGLDIDFKRGGFLGVECPPFTVQCEISRVIPGGAADRAGLRPRDIITQVDETEIEKFADLQQAIGMHAPEDPVTITYQRAGQTLTTELTLGRLPGAPE